MIIGNYNELEWKAMTGEGIKDAFVKVVVSPKEGWDDYVMRIFKLAPGGNTPKHTHEWPHINYIIKGKGTLHLNGKENEIFAGSYAFVPSNELHQFTNIGKEDLEFICIVPTVGHK